MNGVGKVSFFLRFFAGNPMTVLSDPFGLPLVIIFGGNWDFSTQCTLLIIEIR